MFKLYFCGSWGMQEKKGIYEAKKLAEKEARGKKENDSTLGPLTMAN